MFALWSRSGSTTAAEHVANRNRIHYPNKQQQHTSLDREHHHNCLELRRWGTVDDHTEGWHWAGTMRSGTATAPPTTASAAKGRVFFKIICCIIRIIYNDTKGERRGYAKYKRMWNSWECGSHVTTDVSRVITNCALHANQSSLCWMHANCVSNSSFANRLRSHHGKRVPLVPSRH